MSTNDPIQHTLNLQRRHYLFTTVVLISLACVIFGVGIPSVYGWHSWPTSACLLSLAVAGPLILLSARGKERVDAYSHLFMALFILLFSATAWYSGGIRSPAVYVLIFGAPMGVLQLSNKSSLLWTGATLVVLAVLAVWDAKGFPLPELLQPKEIQEVSYVLIGLVVVMLQLHLMEYQSAFIKQLSSLSETTNRLQTARDELAKVHTAFADAALIVSGANEEHGLLRRMSDHSEQGADAFAATQTKLDVMFGSYGDIGSRVEQLSSRGEQIADHLQKIQRISTRLDIMALNAALEAAHAKEAGKSFAPLAKEMRRLSESATEEIHSIREDMELILEHSTEMTQVLANSGDAANDARVQLSELSGIFEDALRLFHESTEALRHAQTLGMQQLDLMSALVSEPSTEAG